MKALSLGHLDITKSLTTFFDHIDEVHGGSTIQDAKTWEYIADEYDPDFVLFGVGVDVGPALYGQGMSRMTQRPDIARDKFESAVYQWAVKRGIPMMGICRGHQFLTVMNGGVLIQHVDGHATGQGGHEIISNEGHYMFTNSFHHQMIYPFYLDQADYELLAWCPSQRSKKYISELDRDFFSHDFSSTGFRESEIIYFPKTMCLGIQGHPEWMSPDSKLVKYMHKKLEEIVSVACSRKISKEIEVQNKTGGSSC